MASSTALELPVRSAHVQNPSLLSAASSAAAYCDDPIPASWNSAIDLFNSNLTKDEKKKIRWSDLERASFDKLLEAAVAAKDRAEQTRFRLTPTLQKIFRQINRYAVAGDIVAQYSTEYTAVAWGAFRFLLLFITEEGNMAAKLSEALNSLIQIVLRAQQYAALFSTHSGSSTSQVFSALQDNLVHLYAEVLNFLVRATIFFKKGTPRRYLSAGFSPFGSHFKGILDQVSKYESNVAKDIALLNAEADIRQQEYEDGKWLKHADFSVRLEKLQKSHLTGTCEWFLRSDSYQNWRNSFDDPQIPNLLWVQGKVGCGKSTLAAQVILDLETCPDVTVAYVFCESGKEDKDDLEGILRNVVYQILDTSSSLRPAFHKLVRGVRLGARTSYAQNMEQLWSLLQRMVNMKIKMCCVIDGLDECSITKEDRVVFLQRLSAIFYCSKTTTKLLVISRLDRSEIGDQSIWNSVQIQPADVEKDIEQLVSIRLRESTKLNQHREKDRIEKTLIDCSDGMILWADLMIKELENSRWDIDYVLDRPPSGLGAVYSVIFQRLSQSHETETKVRHILQLLLAAARPLRLSELAVCLALLEGLRNYEDYDLQGNPDLEGEDIIRKSYPLLTVMPDQTVLLMHSSLREFLLDTKDKNRKTSQLPSDNYIFEMPTLHYNMASCLATYLSFRCFGKASQEISFKGKDLLEYSSRYLIKHTTQSCPSIELAEILAKFFELTSGWRWQERLDNYNISLGHLQLMQSQLQVWSRPLKIDENYQHVLSNFTIILAQRRYKESQAYPIDDETRLSAMLYLARVYLAYGDYKNAERLDIQIMTARKEVLGAEHPVTLSSINNLAVTYIYQGRWETAEKLKMQVIKTRLKILGAEHPDTLASIGNLASIYMNQGRWKEAEELEVQVIKTRLKILGTEHPGTLVSMSNLASTYRNQGRWKEAEELGVQVMKTRKRVLGVEHPSTLTGMANLAHVYYVQGHKSKAIRLMADVTKLRTGKIGADHPHTMAAETTLRKWNTD